MGKRDNLLIYFTCSSAYICLRRPLLSTERSNVIPRSDISTDIKGCDVLSVRFHIVDMFLYFTQEIHNQIFLVAFRNQ